MDELTLDGQTYVSSKRAAQITGYAKDYVGQLCREGRVDARQVGRNWYVLQTSIREHRFGADAVAGMSVDAENTMSGPHTEASEISIASTEIASSPISAWENPIYSTITAPELPVLGDREERVPVVITHEIEEEPLKVGYAEGFTAAEEANSELHKPTAAIVEEMQSAWKDWFTSKPIQVSEYIQGDRATEMPPEEPGMALAVDEEMVPVAITRPQATAQRHLTHVGSFDIAPTPLKSPTSDVREEVAHEDRVSVTRTHSVGMPSESAAVRHREDIMPARIVHERIIKRSRTGASTNRLLQKTARRSKPAYILQVFFVAVALLAVATAWVGTGYAANVLGVNVQNMQPIRYISGAISFNRDSGV